MNVVASYVDQKIPIKVQCLSIQLSCVTQGYVKSLRGGGWCNHRLGDVSLGSATKR
jgi:hypothetical protein